MPDDREFVPPFLDSREERLLVRPPSIKRPRKGDRSLWMATYEWGTDTTVTTLFCAIDGSYGCLTGSGGGILGRSRTDTLGTLGIAFLDVAERHLDSLHPVREIPPPSPPNIWQFIVAT